MHANTISRPEHTIMDRFNVYEVATAALLFIAYAPLFSLDDTDLSGNDQASQWQFLLGWDDRGNFVTNRLFTGTLSWLEWVEHVFMTTRINVYEPVAWLFKWIVFHADNETLHAITVRRASFALHFINTVFLLPDCILRFSNLVQIHRDPATRRRGACFGAAVFAVHPVNVEVIGWPSAQSYVLGGTFALLSTIAFLEYLRDEKDRFVGISVGLYMLSALSKGAFILLPFAFAGCGLVTRLRTLDIKHGGSCYSDWSTLKELVPRKMVVGTLAYVGSCAAILAM